MSDDRVEPAVGLTPHTAPKLRAEGGERVLHLLQALGGMTPQEAQRMCEMVAALDRGGYVWPGESR